MFYRKSIAAGAFLISNSHKNLFNYFNTSVNAEGLSFKNNSQAEVFDFSNCFINPHAEVARRCELYGEWDPEWDGEVMQDADTKDSDLSKYSKLIIFVSKADSKLKTEEKRSEVGQLCKRL